jgi:EKC/KEOPS complex subunit PCC1/LAGE3
VPFPTERLASTPMKAIGVDKELSPLVRRTMEVAPIFAEHSEWTMLRVEYKATTNRMLRVAVNSFFDCLSFSIEVMENMDLDVLEQQEAANEAA